MIDITDSYFDMEKIMKRYLYIMLGLSLTFITDVWAMEDLKFKGREDRKLQVTRKSTPKNTPLKEKEEVPQQPLAVRVLSEVAYFKRFISDEKNLTEFEKEIMAMSWPLNGPEAPKDQIIIVGTRRMF
jgi:hypothetical protein